MGIERNIFHYWDSGEVPAAYAQNVAWTAMSNDDYSSTVIDKMDVAKLVEKHLPEYLETFLAIRIPSAQSDIARMLVLYEHGGWYVDMDMRPRVAFEAWEGPDNSNLVLFPMTIDGKLIVHVGLLGAAKGHPFLLDAARKFLTLIGSRQFNYSVWLACGPTIATHVASKWMTRAETTLVTSEYLEVDIIGDKTKGSWKYQQHVGILYDETSPPIYNNESPRLESFGPEALEFYKSVFADFPQTRNENAVKLVRQHGVEYVTKLGAADYVVEVILAFHYKFERKPDFLAELVEALEELGLTDHIEQLRAKGLV